MKWPNWFSDERHQPLHDQGEPADSAGMDAAELATFIKAATELIIALEAFSKLAERLYPLTLRKHVGDFPTKLT